MVKKKHYLLLVFPRFVGYVRLAGLYDIQRFHIGGTLRTVIKYGELMCHFGSIFVAYDI